MVVLLVWCGVRATAVAGKSSVIAIIIDDMGNNLSLGRRALALPENLTYAFLPHTPHSQHLAERAHQLGKEVMLHQPLESHGNEPLGPGGLTLHLTKTEFQQILRDNLDAIPYVAGVNNHMGSLITRHPGAMHWLMESIRSRGLYFIDSRTTEHSVAHQVAGERQIATARRDVFLDHDIDLEAIRGQFHKLIEVARRRGTAIGIGHPYAQTIQVLNEELPGLKDLGIRVVPVSELTKYYLRRNLWHASSSLSPKVAKNLKLSPLSICCDELKSKSSAPDLMANQ